MRDERFAALTHPIRQMVLLTLLTCPVTDLPLSVPRDLDRGDTDSQSFHLQLYHVHLPHLVSAGYIAWDERHETITRGPRFDDVTPLLRVLI